MGDGRINRVKARTSEIKTRVPDLKERIPDLSERVPDLRERVPDLRAKREELRSRGAELRAEVARQYARMDVSWARMGYACALRQLILRGVLGPLMDWYVRARAVGAEVLEETTPPVIFVANHSSHMDTPTILRSLPRRWRTRTAVAAAADYFYKSRWKANGVALLFNTVPIGRSGGGLSSGATDHVDKLIDQGWNLLIYPEGTRSRDGSIGKVRSGAAVIAAQHGIDLVPIYVHGTHDAMPPGQNWPKRIPGRLFSRRHRVEIRFGEPIRPRDESERREVMDQVRAFWERKGLEVEAEPAPEYDVLLIHEVLRMHEERDGRRFDPVLLAEQADDRPTPAA